VNPVTGKNFSPGWRYDGFLAEAGAFYRRVGEVLGRDFWFPMPVVRLVDEAAMAKLESKLGELAPWIDRIDESPEWAAAVVLRGGRRVAAREFCEATEAFMRDAGRWREAAAGALEVRCEGAAGLMDGRLGPHRC